MRSARHYDKNEIAFIRECSAIGLHAGLIAPLLGRSASGVANKRSSLGIKLARGVKSGPPSPPRTIIKVADIIDATAAHFELAPDILTGPSRLRRYTRPRQVSMFLARRLAQKSFPDIGRKFRRDHTTVIHGVRAVETRRNDDEALDYAVKAIVEAVLSTTNTRKSHFPTSCSVLQAA